MAEILHQLIGSLSYYLQGFIHPRWCRIWAIKSRIIIPVTRFIRPFIEVISPFITVPLEQNMERKHLPNRKNCLSETSTAWFPQKEMNHLNQPLIFSGENVSHRENVGTIRMVPLIINPIYTLYSGYLLGISPFKGLPGGLVLGRVSISGIFIFGASPNPSHLKELPQRCDLGVWVAQFEAQVKGAIWICTVYIYK